MTEAKHTKGPANFPHLDLLIIAREIVAAERFHPDRNGANCWAIRLTPKQLQRLEGAIHNSESAIYAQAYHAQTGN